MGAIENSTLTLLSDWLAIGVDRALGNDLYLGTVKKTGPSVNVSITKGTQVVFERVESFTLTNEGKELVFVREKYIISLAVPK